MCALLEAEWHISIFPDEKFPSDVTCVTSLIKSAVFVDTASVAVHML